MFKDVYKNFITFFNDIFKIFKDIKLLSIWILILPINIIISTLNIFIGLIYYLKLITIFIIKFIKKKIKYKNIKPIKINKRKISFNNYILETIYLLTVDISVKKAFLLFYNQLYILKNFKKNEITLINKIKNFFELVLLLFIKRLIFYLTSIPFFILKNNNELTFLIKDVNNMNCETFEIYLSTLFANIIKDFNLISNFETKKLRIKFDKKNIYLNPPKPSDFLSSLNSPDKLAKGTKELIKSGRIAMLKYNIIKSTNIKSHPTLLYETIDRHNKDEPVYLAINQSTKEYLNIAEEIRKDFLLKNKIKNEIEMKGILNKELTAYAVTPHIVHKDLTTIVNSNKLITSWGKHENWIKQFNMVQSFLLNLDNKMLKIDKNHGILIDKDYKTVRDYIDKNYLWFNKNTQIGLENIIDFYEKNKLLFSNNGNKLAFTKCLILAEIDPEVKNLFKNILDRYS